MTSATFTDLSITNTTDAFCGIGAPMFVAGGTYVGGNMCVDNGAFSFNGFAVSSGNFTTAAGVSADLGGSLSMNITNVISSGLKARCGTATLTAGSTPPIMNNTLTANTVILTSRIAPASPASNTGFLYTPTVTPGVGGVFVIRSSMEPDNGSVAWWLLEQF
jgi:hypothetical protein